MLREVFDNPWVRALALLGALLVLCFVVYALSAVLIPLVSAFLVAYILDPVVDWFERRKISRSRAVGILVSVAVVLLLLIPVYIVPSAIAQAYDLLDGLVTKARASEIEGYPSAPKTLQKVETPAATTPEALAELLKVPVHQTTKSVFFEADKDGKPVLVLIRGDLDVSEERLARLIQVAPAPATEDRVRATGAVPGYASPMGLDPEKVRVVVDESIKTSNNLVVGANEENRHYINFNLERDLPETRVSKIAQRDSGFELYVERVIGTLPLESFVNLLGWRDPDTHADVGAKEIILDRFAKIAEQNRTKFKEAVTDNFMNISGGLSSSFLAVLSSLGSLGQGVLGIILFLANLAVFGFVAGYLLRDFDGVVHAMGDLVPPAHRPKTYSIVGKIDMQVRSFLRGQVTVCMCMALMYAIGFGISGVPFWVLIAVWGGFAAFIPFIGATLTVVPAAIFTLLQYGLDWHVIGVIATFVVVQFVEGNILTPNIVGKEVGLHPVWVILAVLVFGSLLGFVGLLIAVPLAACLKVLVMESLDYYRKSAVFLEDNSGG
jgi:predicted PurR-regulated permease PerM